MAGSGIELTHTNPLPTVVMSAPSELAMQRARLSPIEALPEALLDKVIKQLFTDSRRRFAATSRTAFDAVWKHTDPIQPANRAIRQLGNTTRRLAASFDNHPVATRVIRDAHMLSLQLAATAVAAPKALDRLEALNKLRDLNNTLRDAMYSRPYRDRASERCEDAWAGGGAFGGFGSGLMVPLATVHGSACLVLGVTVSAAVGGLFTGLVACTVPCHISRAINDIAHANAALRSLLAVGQKIKLELGNATLRNAAYDGSGLSEMELSQPSSR